MLQESNNPYCCRCACAPLCPHYILNIHYTLRQILSCLPTYIHSSLALVTHNITIILLYGSKAARCYLPYFLCVASVFCLCGVVWCVCVSVCEFLQCVACVNRHRCCRVQRCAQPALMRARPVSRHFTGTIQPALDGATYYYYCQGSACAQRFHRHYTGKRHTSIQPATRTWPPLTAVCCC